LAQTANSPQRSDGSAVGENPTLDQRAAVGASLANGRYADIGIMVIMPISGLCRADVVPRTGAQSRRGMSA
jgi:hypothetical protein